MTAVSIGLVAALSLPFLLILVRRPVLRRLAVPKRDEASARGGSGRARVAARRGDHHGLRRRRRHHGRLDPPGRPHAPRPDRRARGGAQRRASRRSSSACCRPLESGNIDGVLGFATIDAGVTAVGAQHVRAAPRSQVVAVDFDEAARFGGDTEAAGVSQAATPGAGTPRSPPIWLALSKLSRATRSTSTPGGQGRPGRRPHPAAARGRRILDGPRAGSEQRRRFAEHVRRDPVGAAAAAFPDLARSRSPFVAESRTARFSPPK